MVRKKYKKIPPFMLDALGAAFDATVCVVVDPELPGRPWVREQIRKLPGGDSVVDVLEKPEQYISDRLDCNDVDYPGKFFGIPAGFTGGQCPSFYDVSVTVDIVNVSTGEATAFTASRPRIQGPIFGIVKRGARATKEIVAVTAAGDVRILSNTSPNSDYKNLRDREVEPQPGQPDNCGNPPVEPPGYKGPLPYIDEEGNEQAPLVEFTFGPVTVDVDGRRYFNIEGSDEFGDFEFEYNPEFNFEGDASKDGCGCAPTYDPELPPPSESADDPPTPAQQRRILGVVTVATKITDTQTTTTFRGNNAPTLYLPRLGSVVFACNIGGRGAWTKPIDIETLKQWTPVEGDIPAYHLDVKPSLGFAIESFPVYLDNPGEE